MQNAWRHLSIYKHEKWEMKMRELLFFELSHVTYTFILIQPLIRNWILPGAWTLSDFQLSVGEYGEISSWSLASMQFCSRRLCFEVWWSFSGLSTTSIFFPAINLCPHRNESTFRRHWWFLTNSLSVVCFKLTLEECMACFVANVIEGQSRFDLRIRAKPRVHTILVSEKSAKTTKPFLHDEKAEIFFGIETLSHYEKLVTIIIIIFY